MDKFPELSPAQFATKSAEKRQEAVVAQQAVLERIKSKMAVEGKVMLTETEIPTNNQEFVITPQMRADAAKHATFHRGRQQP